MHEGKCQETDTTSLARVKDIKTQPRVNHLPERNRINLITEIRQVLCNLYYSAPDAVEEVPAHDGVGGGVALEHLAWSKYSTLNTLQAGQVGLQTLSLPSLASLHPTDSQCTCSKIASKHSTASSISPNCHAIRGKKKRGARSFKSTIKILRSTYKNPKLSNPSST